MLLHPGSGGSPAALQMVQLKVAALPYDKRVLLEKSKSYKKKGPSEKLIRKVLKSKKTVSIEEMEKHYYEKNPHMKNMQPPPRTTIPPRPTRTSTTTPTTIMKTPSQVKKGPKPGTEKFYKTNMTNNFRSLANIRASTHGKNHLSLEHMIDYVNSPFYQSQSPFEPVEPIVKLKNARLGIMGGPDMTPLRQRPRHRPRPMQPKPSHVTPSKPELPEQKETGSEPEVTEKPKSLLDLTPEQIRDLIKEVEPKLPKMRPYGTTLGRSRGRDLTSIVLEIIEEVKESRKPELEKTPKSRDLMLEQSKNIMIGRGRPLGKMGGPDMTPLIEPEFSRPERNWLPEEARPNVQLKSGKTIPMGPGAQPFPGARRGPKINPLALALAKSPRNVEVFEGASRTPGGNLDGVPEQFKEHSFKK